MRFFPAPAQVPIPSHLIHLLLARGGIRVGGVAQLVEQENHNLLVRGSSPFAATERYAVSQGEIHLDGWEVGSLG